MNREDKAEVIYIEYFGSKEANVKIRWFDNKKNEWVILKGILEEVEE